MFVGDESDDTGLPQGGIQICSLVTYMMNVKMKAMDNGVHDIYTNVHPCQS